MLSQMLMLKKLQTKCLRNAKFFFFVSWLSHLSDHTVEKNSIDTKNYLNSVQISSFQCLSENFFHKFGVQNRKVCLNYPLKVFNISVFDKISA